MLYLYGIIDKPSDSLPLPRGLGGAATDILPITGLGAVAGSINSAALEDGENLRRHMVVLEALMPHRTVVPARFGSVFSAREELDEYVSESRDTFIEDIKRVQGHIEMSLRVVDKRPRDEGRSGEGAPSASQIALGGGYLAARRAEAAEKIKRVRELGRLAATVLAPLAALVKANKWRPLSLLSGKTAVSVALLLRRDRLDSFRLALGALRQSEPWLEITSDGPLPPYSFVNGAQQFVPERSFRAEAVQPMFG